MKNQLQNRLIGGLVLMMLFSIPSFTLGAQHEGSPWIFDLHIDLRPVVHIITTPYRFLAFVKESIQEQGEDISQKTLALLRSPYALTSTVKEGIDLVEVKLPQQLASLFGTKENSKSQITNYKQITNFNDQIFKPVIARSEATKQSQIQDTKYQILNTTKEIIREVVLSQQPASSSQQPAEQEAVSRKLEALKTELNQSFADRLNKFSGPYGFTSNRFDEIFINKEIKVGSGNVKLATFTSIANASSTTQFSASGIEDKLSFEGSGLTTISFDGNAKKITISTPTPSLLTILQTGADASTFTGTTKISGLTIDSSGFVVLPSGTSTTPSLTFSGDTDTGIFGKASDILGFSTGGSERMRITGAGNVELSGSLTLSGFALLPHGTSTTPSLAFSGDTDTGIFAKESNILAFSTAGTERLRLDASGNALFAGFLLLPQGTSTTPSLGFQDDTDTGIFSKGSNILAFGTAGLERMRIDGSGNVAIGKTSADQKLDVAGTLQTTGLKLSTSPTDAYVLTSDSTGVASWQPPVWRSCVSSPAFATSSTFTVTNNQASTDAYYIGRIVRYKDTAGGATFQYTAVSAYSAGTVTVADGGLDSGFASCQMANFSPLKFTFAIPGRLPLAATNNISSRIIVGETFEPVRVNWYVEVMASTNGATAGNTTIRLRSGTSPTTDGTTDVMAANTLAYNASEKLNVNPTHTTISDGTYLQVDVTGAPTGGQADDLTLILYGVPLWAKNL